MNRHLVRSSKSLMMNLETGKKHYCTNDWTIIGYQSGLLDDSDIQFLDSSLFQIVL